MGRAVVAVVGAASAVLCMLGCGRHLNAEWCAVPGHDDPACDRVPGDAADARTDGTPCPPGGCGDAPGVLYAAPRGQGSACTVDAKCTVATAINQAVAGRTRIVLDPGIYPGPLVIDRDVQLVGPARPSELATLAADGVGPAVTVTGSATVELTGVELTGATGGSGLSCLTGTLHAQDVSIVNNRHGVTSACTLTLERSRIHRNVEGALAITAGTIDIHDNFIVRNGGDRIMDGAIVAIGAGVAGSFAFNTVAYNDLKKGTPGVDCRSAITGAGNLVTDNMLRGAFGGAAQVTGLCAFTEAYTQPGAGGNDLRWVDIDTADFHLTAASAAALDGVPAVACADRVDIDGQPRPTGGGCDFGADELDR